MSSGIEFELERYLNCLRTLTLSGYSINSISTLHGLGFGDLEFYEQHRPMLDTISFRSHSSIQIHGPQGSGKTTLLRLLAYRARHNTARIIVSISDNLPSTVLHSARNLLAFIVYQLLFQCPPLFSRVASLYSYYCPLWALTEQELWKFLGALLRNNSSQGILFFVDESDELLPSSTSFFKKLAEFVSSLQSSCVFFFTSHILQPDLTPVSARILGLESSCKTDKYQNDVLEAQASLQTRKRPIAQMLKRVISQNIKSFGPTFQPSILYIRQLSRLSPISTLAASKHGLQLLPQEENAIYEHFVQELLKTEPETLK